MASVDLDLMAVVLPFLMFGVAPIVARLIVELLFWIDDFIQREKP